MEEALNLLRPEIRTALVEKGITELTGPQKEAIPLILSGDNVLIVAPTGSGKTEAAILPIFNMLLNLKDKGEFEVGIKVLYITPLRALNRDLLDRITYWADRLGFTVAVRHGDTEQRERTKQSLRPPDILITTPETLQAILSGRILRSYLKALRWVIVDEVHEIAEDKRGSQLSLALERLRYIIQREFQIVGLSATIGTPERAAEFLVGVGRPVRIVHLGVERKMKLKVIFPKPTALDLELASKIYVRPEVAARLRLVKEFVERYRAALIFTNTRATAEVLASRFKLWIPNFPLGIHHGSLSKLSREKAEKDLKSGELKALVCTSSLELGIDIGSVDIVIQYMSPRQVTHLVQRVGRSGHKIGRVARGVIITADEDDTLEATVIARRALKGLLEPLRIPSKPLDVLCHQIAALFQLRRRWTIDEIFNLYSRAYPYRDLTREELIKVLEYMHERYPRLAWVSFEDGVVLKPRRVRGVYEYFFDHLSMIPEEKQYIVINVADNNPVGVLDEPFIAEYGERGVKFVFRGSLWRIKDIIGDKVYVESISDPTGAVPSWVGEEIPVPFEVAQEVGAIKRLVVTMLEKGCSLREIASKLARKYSVEEGDLRRVLSPFIEHVSKGFVMPTDKLILAEILENRRILLYTHIGSLGNRALGRIIAEKIAERVGVGVGVQQDPYVIFLELAEPIKDIGRILREIIESLPNEDLRRLLREKAKKFGLFKRRLIHVARRFGALRKGVDYSSISMRKLVELFEGTVIFEEALKEFFTKDVDLDSVRTILNDLREGRRKLVIVLLKSPSPLANLAFTKISMKTEIIPPERLSKIIIETTKARLLSEVFTATCIECKKWVGLAKIDDLLESIQCPLCGSKRIGLVREDERIVKRLMQKNFDARSRRDERVVNAIFLTADLIEKYGWKALLAIASRISPLGRVKRFLEDLKDASEINEVVEEIVKEEKRCLRARYW